MRILLLGKNGQLGWELHRTLQPLGNVIGLDFPQIDLLYLERLPEIIHQIEPDLIVNATAYTAVDRAESETETAFAINAQAPRVMAEEAIRLGAFLIHFSTDYVFDGSKGIPYTEDDLTSPLNVYGKSKLEGETGALSCAAALVFRTSWVYSLRSGSFVSKVLEWSRQQSTLRLVTDQISGPTWARILAETTAQVIAMATSHTEPLGWLTAHQGLYHLAGSGWASRMQWGEAILRNDPRPEEQITRQIQPALTADFPAPARRPLFSALNCDRFAITFGLCLPPWEESLQLAFEKAGF